MSIPIAWRGSSARFVRHDRFRCGGLRVVPAGRLPQGRGIFDGAGQGWRPDPFSGALHVFRSKRADRVRIVWWDGSGVCLYSKTLEDHSFCWPGISAARMRLDHAQLMALLAGLDWKKIRPARVRRPLSTG
ncbi:IS66 family insertion sequence element accessory protein TnpB (plasmid) [Mesorhizobium sp. AR07]|uniref:IS66 family insertion sequence element accessory protein TnpB n=1 Tax=Mesorhizobium sp. AR07 TaxID=2865838 RepID=UPI002202DC47|nr:IS66 family insertion sequence element accessory protein TnpB [Mesorhizobium sp. AR07]